MELQQLGWGYGTDRYGSGQVQVAGCFDCGNELPVSIKCGEFLDQLRTGQLLKKGSAAWSYCNHYIINCMQCPVASVTDLVRQPNTEPKIFNLSPVANRKPDFCCSRIFTVTQRISKWLKHDIINAKMRGIVSTSDMVKWLLSPTVSLLVSVYTRVYEPAIQAAIWSCQVAKPLSLDYCATLQLRRTGCSHLSVRLIDQLHYINFQYRLVLCSERNQISKQEIHFDIFVNCRLVATRWQQYSTHLHTHTHTHTQTIHRTTQNKQ